MSEKSSIDKVSLSIEAQNIISSNIKLIREKMCFAASKSPYHQIPRLLLATKTRSPEEIDYAISLGIDLIGENRVQELCNKYDKIQKENVEIHFIGALQTNKVKFIIDKVSMIHSLDRYSLALEIDKQARKIGKVMNVLVEINIGNEPSKSGILPNEAEEFLKSISKLKNIRVCGLMAIPPVMKNISTQKQYFQKIMDLYIDISAKKIDNIGMTVLSIGMSSDYDLAIENGSTLVRIGTAAFGERNYDLK
jgi:pyridoxal phosphate enzyme (YggS family)